MPRYPSEECKHCLTVMKVEEGREKSKSPDGTFKFPTFELASCSCFRLFPKGCLKVTKEKHESRM